MIIDYQTYCVISIRFLNHIFCFLKDFQNKIILTMDFEEKGMDIENDEIVRKLI